MLNLDTNSKVPRALAALVEQCQKDPSLAADKDIQLIVQCKRRNRIPTSSSHPRIIPLHHGKMYRPRDLSILLVTRDPVQKFRDQLKENEMTADMFREVISIRGLRRRIRDAAWSHEFDLVVADFRIHKFLPKALGGHKPYLIQMVRETPNSKLREPQSEKNKRETLDPSFIRAQLRNICKNTSYVPGAGDLCIKIGERNRHPLDQVAKNMLDVVEFLQKEYTIESLSVKTAHSVALPCYP